MSSICTCTTPEIVFSGKLPHCAKCGSWWDIEHGSHVPGSQEAKEAHRGQQRGAVVERNDPCPCGSGKKFKKCCMFKKE